MNYGLLKDYSETVPIQYEEGRAGFMGMDIRVDRRVLIPRPETEILVNAAADICRQKGWERPRVLEIGSGSGVIPVALTRLLEGCSIVSADISEDALDVARENIACFAPEGDIELVRSDMFDAFGEEHENGFDCVVSNPPYVSEEDYENLDAWVKAEPRVALCAGREGMDFLRIIARESGRYLRPGGFVALEMGYDQARKVESELFRYGFTAQEIIRDFNGHERVIVGWKNG